MIQYNTPMTDQSKEAVREGETLGAKLRNKLSPIFNHFQMRADLDKSVSAMSVKDLQAFQRIFQSNEATCNEVIPKILELLSAIERQTADLQARCDGYEKALKEISDFKVMGAGAAKYIIDIAKEAINTADAGKEGI